MSNLENIPPQVLADRHDIIAHHLLRIGSMLEDGGGRSFLMLQGRTDRDILGQIQKNTFENSSFTFSMVVLQRLLPDAAFPVQILHDAGAEDPLILRFSGLAPSRNDQGCLAAMTADLEFLGRVPGFSTEGSGEIYVIGNDPLNVADRLATLHAKTPEEALLKFTAVVYPGISEDQSCIQDVELDGLSMRRLDTWSRCDVEQIWKETKMRLLTYIERNSEPEPDFGV